MVNKHEELNASFAKSELEKDVKRLEELETVNEIKPKKETSSLIR